MSSNITDSENGLSEAIPKVLQTIRAASALAAQDVKFYASLDKGLAGETEDSATSLLSLANSMLQKCSDEFRSFGFGEDYVSSDVNWKNVSNALDNVFEKIDLAMDQLRNPQKGEQSLLYLEDGKKENDIPKVLVKPQLDFKNKIDNSDSHPFQPKLKFKPHALRSFHDSIKLVLSEPNSNGDVNPPFYIQPYEYEIMHQPVPEDAIRQSMPIPSTDWNSTEAIWVNDVENLNQMVKILKELSEIAVDLEHHDYRSYYGLTCLMQISNREQDWIVDTLALWDDLQVLNEVFADPNIIKVFHGAFMDIIWLQRDLGLYVVSLFDTYHASKKLGFPKFSLAYLLETYAKFKTSKKYQLADWRIRPLLASMMQYARSDTHFLLNIYDQLRNKLIASGDQKLQEVLFESRKVACRKFEHYKFRLSLADSNGFHSNSFGIGQDQAKYFMSQYNLPLGRQHLVLELLLWRDSKAREEDESTRYIMSNQVLVNLASLNLPVKADRVLGVSNFLADVVRLNAHEVAALIENSLTNLSGNDADGVLLPSVSNVDGDIDYSIASKISLAFDQIETPHLKIVEKDESSLIGLGSNLFSGILAGNVNQFSVQFDCQLKVVQELTSADYLERWKYLQESLTPFPFAVLQRVPEISNMDDVAVNVKPQDITMENTAENHLNGDEVVTLSKKKMKRTHNPETSITTEPIFDYGAAENANILENKSSNSKHKKRSFDPFSKGRIGGPQGAKKGRFLNFGKSTSFTKKR